MNRRGIVISGVLTALLLVAAGSVLMSRHRAHVKADDVMQPTFQQGWYRGKTRPILRLNGEWQPCWMIQYEMDHPTAIVDFGPHFLISLSGEILIMSPDDLKERIRKNADALRILDHNDAARSRKLDKYPALVDELLEEIEESNHGLESTSAPPAAGTPETHP